MVSHGFATVDDFYAKNSMRLSVARVKIPVLFIQV
jgi:predicted alpha/beta-fold hydrolase